MSFIKRSTVTPVKVIVGDTLKKCSICKKPLVGKNKSATICETCIEEQSDSQE